MNQYRCETCTNKDDCDEYESQAVRDVSIRCGLTCHSDFQSERDCPVCGGGLMCHRWCIDRDCGWDSIKGTPAGGFTMNPLKGELEYGLISLDDKEDYRLYRYPDAGMGETEYRIFRNGAFFAMFDTRKDAEEVMTVMTHKREHRCPYWLSARVAGIDGDTNKYFCNRQAGEL